MSLAFDNLTLSEAVGQAMSYLEAGNKCRVVTPNAEIAYLAERDEELRRIINSAELVLPDGVGVLKAASLLGTPLKEKVAGVEFGEALLKAVSGSGHTAFFYGGKPGIAELAAQTMRDKYPGLAVCGVIDGYRPEEEACAAINAARPDLLFVCLGAPKQERFMDRHRDDLEVTLMAGLGGSLDIFSGTVKRAPRIFIRLGLEWFYRLLSQPSRIGRMMKLPLYLREASRAKKKRGRENA